MKRLVVGMKIGEPIISFAHFLLHLGLGRVAFGLAQVQPTLAFAAVLALAGVVRGLTSRLALALVDPVALNLGFLFGGDGRNAGGGEQSRRGGGHGKTGKFSGVHIFLSILEHDERYWAGYVKPSPVIFRISS
jgi:hypothetical protein